MVPPGRPTQVKTVARTSQYDGRVIYAVTLACGCSFLEHRLSTEAAPEVGRADLCFASHSDEPLDPNGIL